MLTNIEYMPNAEHEALRQRYLPQSIRVLFLGESPPASGTFFYAANSNLYRYTQRAFEEAYQRRWAAGAEFLTCFQSCGCYLDDLCLDPVNHMDAIARRRVRNASVPSLADRLQQTTPMAVVSVMTATAAQVNAAIARSGINPLFLDYLPFPTFGNQHKYVQRLTFTLHKLRNMGILALAWYGSPDKTPGTT